MTSRPAFDTPSTVQVIDGEVVVIGPESVGHAFTPKAARETGRRLEGAADAADGRGAVDGEAEELKIQHKEHEDR